MRKRKLFFDEKRMTADVADVLEASALLRVTEFELFRIRMPANMMKSFLAAPGCPLRAGQHGHDVAHACHPQPR